MDVEATGDLGIGSWASGGGNVVVVGPVEFWF